MKKIKLSAKQLQEAQIHEEKKFNRSLIIWFSILLSVVVISSITAMNWCELKFYYREVFLYGKEVSPANVCMCGNNLKIHSSKKFRFHEKEFFACGKHCAEELKMNYDSLAFIQDALTGKTICKADAIIGLKARKASDVIYFENEENLRHYYDSLKTLK